MTPKQLRKAGETLAKNDPETYGHKNYGWQAALARKIGVLPRTVSAWLTKGKNQSPISQATAMLIERLVEESRKQK